MPRAETVNLQVRVPAQLKRDADILFRSMGLETGDAVRVFLTQAVGHRAMPFEMAEPKDINGFTRAQAERLLRAKAQLYAGKGVQHELVQD